MKKTIFLTSIFLVGSLLSCLSQNISSGIIKYEVMEKIDPSKMKLIINGQEVKPGSMEAPPDLPDVRSYSLHLIFSDGFAKEEQTDNGLVVQKFEGTPGGQRAPNKMAPEPPFTEKKYINLSENKYIHLLELKAKGEKNLFQAEESFQKLENWRETSQTKKIAGYVCKKATVEWKGDNYTIWYTTAINFTYSPIKALTPDKGVVLQLEGSNESFKATEVQTKAIAENEVKPAEKAEQVTMEELGQIKERAMATFRQQTFGTEGR
jgi:GLPGLI family protein